MTKQHFKAFAEIIRKELVVEEKQNFVSPRQYAEAHAVVDVVCRVSKQFNSVFDEAKFRKACGL